MKPMTKVLFGVVAAALVMAVYVPVAEAQCATGARSVATVGGGGGTNKLRVLPPDGGAASVGGEFGRFWECENSLNGNNFIPGDAQKKMAPAGTGGCASTDAAQAGGGWWQVSQTTKYGIEGFISGAGCVASSCPVGDLCVVVESAEAALPAIGSGAYFIGWRTEETPPTIRYWDLSKFCGPQDTATNCDVPLEEFPVPFITSATKDGVDRAIVTDTNTDPSINVYVHTPNAGPASSLIATYDLMIHTGPGDPGRDRNSGAWTLLQSIPYADAALSGVPITVPCDNTVDDALIAFGMTFVGGPPGGPVPSQLVGRAIAIECDPNIADPKQKPKTTIRMDERPTGTRTPERSRGGR